MSLITHIPPTAVYMAAGDDTMAKIHDPGLAMTVRCWLSPPLASASS